MESQPSFVRAKSRVELNTVSAVDLEFAFVVFPNDTELNDTLWDGNDFESSFVLWVFFKERTSLQG